MWVDRVKLDTWVSNSLLNVSGEAGEGYRLSNRASHFNDKGDLQSQVAGVYGVSLPYNGVIHIRHQCQDRKCGIGGRHIDVHSALKLDHVNNGEDVISV